MRNARPFVLLGIALVCQGCIVAPLPISAPLDITIVDASSGLPIPGAVVVHYVCDVHEFSCRNARLVRTTSSAGGRVEIPRRWRWGLWIAAPGGLPVPNHFIAVWAPGYSPFMFSQYDDPLERVIERIRATRPDVAEELKTLPAPSSSDPSLNPPGEFRGGRLRLRRSVA